MKKLIILISVVFGLLFSSINATTIYKRDIDVNYFYSALDQHGEWIEIGYDDYVWRPYKSDYNWRPYSDGRWEWTRNGWYWVSYEPFGWATYHYGRWYNDDYYGWVWMPDDVWAPAWVEWRYNDYYIGWAPLPPYARFNRRSGIHFSISWHSGYTYWNFVKYNHFVSYNIHNYYVDRYYVKNVFNKTKHRTNYFAENNRIVNGGISRRFVERKIGKKLTTRRISKTDNYKEYRARDKKSRKAIVTFKPNERSVRKATFNKKSVTKGRALKSLKTDKVAINRRKVVKNSNDTKTIKNTSGRIEKNNRKSIRKRAEVNGSSKRINRNSDLYNMKRSSSKKGIEKKSTSRTEKKLTGRTEKRTKNQVTTKSNNRRVSKKGYTKKTSQKKIRSKSSRSKSNRSRY